MRLPGYRALGAFWAGLLAVCVAGAGTLAWLGPPNAQVATATSAATPAPAPMQTPVAPAPAALPVAAEPPRAPPDPAALANPTIAPPDPALLEASPHGPLPRLGADGRSSIRAYARPFDRGDPRPRIGIVISNIGSSAQHSEEAVARLPGAVTLAVSPYAIRPEPLLDRARARGMELLVALPLEPQGFGQVAFPGERALLTSLTVAENLDRLDALLATIQGQVGAIGGLSSMRGERFAANPELLGTVQDALTRRGLLYVDPRPGAPGPARAFGRSVDLLLDEPSAVRSEVERRLTELEALARSQGSALGLAGNPSPSVVAAIAAWSNGLDGRGVVLAPVTVLIRRPSEQASR